MLETLTALIVPFLVSIWNVTAGTSLLHCPCYAGVLLSQLLKQCAVYIRDEKEKLKLTPRRNAAVINLLKHLCRRREREKKKNKRKSRKINKKHRSY